MYACKELGTSHLFKSVSWKLLFKVGADLTINECISTIARTCNVEHCCLVSICRFMANISTAISVFVLFYQELSTITHSLAS